MDSGDTKADSESTVFKGDNIINHGAAERADRIANYKSVSVCSRLHCPLLTTSKALPTNMDLRVSLSRNSNDFLLIADANDYKVHIEDVLKFAFFCIQRSKDFEGSVDTNPFTFIPFGKFQLYLNGVPYFNDGLEIDYQTKNTENIYRENRTSLEQMYKTIGKHARGCGLLNSLNFQQNFIVAVSLTNDRSSSLSSYLSFVSVGN